MIPGRKVEAFKRPIIKGVPKSKIIIKNTEYELIEVKERAVYDTLVIGNRTGGDYTLLPGTTFAWFENVSGKGKQYTNCDKAHQIPSGWAGKFYYVGIIPRIYWGNTRATANEVMKVLENLYIEFRIFDDIIINGPYYEFESGRGFAGESTESDTSFISIGVPASGTKRALLEPIELDYNDAISCIARYERTNLTDSSDHEIENPVIPEGVVVTLTFELRGLVAVSALKR